MENYKNDKKNKKNIKNMLNDHMSFDSVKKWIPMVSREINEYWIVIERKQGE